MRNVFQAASFERMVLIHDDDLMVPGGVDVLVLDYVATYRKSDVSILLTTRVCRHSFE